jgi:YD repeat-containing protein
MTTVGMNNYPVETIHKSDDVVIASKLTKFREWDGRYFPQQILTLSAKDGVQNFDSFDGTIEDSHYDLIPEASYDDYDSYGNPTQITTKDGVVTSYYWSYNHQYPIIQAENVTYSELIEGINDLHVLKAAILIDGFFENYLSKDLSTSIDRQERLKWVFNELKNNLPDQAFLHVYTYTPLVGMTSETDPNGITTYYEYDDFGRLKLTKDSDGNIIERYDYNYAQKPTL